ncbi:MAG TPA: hypothetical protein VM580_18100 [Labilithrix sp.]|nr:hypothetical protein [Labilithrix sp.]
MNFSRLPTWTPLVCGALALGCYSRQGHTNILNRDARRRQARLGVRGERQRACTGTAIVMQPGTPHVDAGRSSKLTAILERLCSTNKNTTACAVLVGAHATKAAIPHKPERAFELATSLCEGEEKNCAPLAGCYSMSTYDCGKRHDLAKARELFARSCAALLARSPALKREDSYLCKIADGVIPVPTGPGS